ncbi:MAG: hypothetical protein JNL60_19380 [Bacteroidia bacterium]|nr:hypothetical protein [Bacteroidia bacterium]
MRTLKSLLYILLLLLGLFLSLYSLTSIPQIIIEFRKMDGPESAGYAVGYLIGSVLFAWFAVWLFLKGLRGLRKKKKVAGDSEYLDLPNNEQ